MLWSTSLSVLVFDEVGCFLPICRSQICVFILVHLWCITNVCLSCEVSDVLMTWKSWSRNFICCAPGKCQYCLWLMVWVLIYCAIYSIYVGSNQLCISCLCSLSGHVVSAAGQDAPSPKIIQRCVRPLIFVKVLLVETIYAKVGFHSFTSNSSIDDLTRNWLLILMQLILRWGTMNRRRHFLNRSQASERFLNERTLQLESYEMSQYTQEQHAAAWPCDHLVSKHSDALKIWYQLPIHVVRLKFGTDSPSMLWNVTWKHSRCIRYMKFGCLKLLGVCYCAAPFPLSLYVCFC
jgi:hypothetical protein